MSDFRPYQSFVSAAAAEPLLALLEEHAIPYETVGQPGQASFDPSFANNQLGPQLGVKLRAADFERVRRLEEEASVRGLDQLPADYYLFTFSDEELLDLLSKPDEWNPFDVALAGRLLRERGRDVSADAISLLRQRRLAELARPDHGYTPWIWLGYVLAAVGGLLGLFIGWHLYSHKKQLPNGQRLYAYSEKDRAHGRRLIVLGTLGMLVWAVLRFYLKRELD